MSIIAPKTISAVDAGTDQLTIVAHGLVTGDPFVGVYSADGTLPAPLVGTADYWVIRDDANTIRLATSSANAMAGTAIDLTTSGSGTLQLVQGLPYRRPMIAVPLAQLKTAHINATWESLQALWNRLTGQPQTVWSGARRVVTIPIHAQNTDGNAGSTVPLAQAPAEPLFTYAPIPGTLLKSVIVTLTGNDTVDATIHVSKIDAAGGGTQLDELAITNVPAAGAEYTLDADALPYTLLDSEHFIVSFSGVSAAAALNLVKLRAVVEV